MNQTVNDGTWVKLGTYDLLPNAGHKVVLSDRANGQVAADAIRLVSAGNGELVARWSGTVGSAGTYQVWARWTAAPSHTFAATYRVTTPGGTDSVTVDQRSGGGQWHLLKTLTLAANDNWQVELSDQTPGEVVADAIAITPPISLADKFEWAPTLPAAGDYAVYAKWQADASRASDATYEITHDGGVAQVSVDQTRNGAEWRYLGSWSFDPAGSPKVTLLASLTGTLSVDAIRFVAGDAIGGDIVYTHSDQLGTIQKMTDASGSLAWDRTQRPFGETVAISAASGVANQLRFPGQYADETGLSYNYFRDYDPTLGRYLESDPIGFGGGPNTYAYAGNGPIRFTDVKGLKASGGTSAACCPPIPESQCCNEARAASMFKGDGGGVFCCNGRKTACLSGTMGKSSDGTANGIIRRCAIRHEHKHFDDVECSSSCGIERPGFRPERSPQTGECRGYSAELSCLQTALAECGTNFTCTAAVQVRIAQITRFARLYCSSGH